ncbi:MAG TPA: 2-succinyl-5-enolpyruvyl-6-hydroxy-3-cyclohexene-1-carboxylic-acid synthase [Thermoleophilaceae bacterium]|nr:2-succinyl-5-enolpyruvyl-6-hydroxy-3-cyclohexene-1-carboxylic-acid synthase [Thermoleophilaceae bacterium]
MLHETRYEDDFRHTQMIPVNTTFAPIQVLVDEFVRCGMTHAVTCPGSRNAPIALTLAAQDGLTAVSVLDERSAGFVALGIAKTTGRPVAITTTSGTAAANLMPAVVEAHESAVPLVVLTADRPPELREVGAGQAIDQIKLYGSFAKLFVEAGNLPAGRDSAVHHRQLGCRAYYTASLGRPGPVHLNFPLREPLAPRTEDLDAADWEGRRGGQPWTRASAGPPAASFDLDTAPERGLIVCGGDAGDFAAAAVHLGRALGWPVLAEPTSGARFGTSSSGETNVVAHYDLLVRSETFAAERPELVIRVGQMPTSKPLRAWLSGCRQVIVDSHLDWHDPTRMAGALLAVAPEALEMYADASGEPAAGSGAGSGAWLDRWRAADAIVAEELAATEEPFEPLAYNALADTAETVWVSSSLPIRDFESYFPRTDRRIRILSNRGASGIDGVVSSAAGASIAARAPVHLAIGELALLHDVGGLVTARRGGAELAILCVNNGGGGIFDFLPVAEQADRDPYEQHIATPVDLDLATVAALGGLEHRVVADAAGVREHLRPGTLVEFRIDRATSLARHRELAARITARLDQLTE